MYRSERYGPYGSSNWTLCFLSSLYANSTITCSKQSRICRSVGSSELCCSSENWMLTSAFIWISLHHPHHHLVCFSSNLSAGSYITLPEVVRYWNDVQMGHLIKKWKVIESYRRFLVWHSLAGRRVSRQAIAQLHVMNAVNKMVPRSDGEDETAEERLENLQMPSTSLNWMLSASLMWATTGRKSISIWDSGPVKVMSSI